GDQIRQVGSQRKWHFSCYRPSPKRYRHLRLALRNAGRISLCAVLPGKGFPNTSFCVESRRECKSTNGIGIPPQGDQNVGLSRDDLEQHKYLDKPAGWTSDAR